MTRLEQRAAEILEPYFPGSNQPHPLVSDIVQLAREFGEQSMHAYAGLGVVSRGMTHKQRIDAALAAAEGDAEP